MSVNQLVVDIVRLEPKNWQDLASASRFLEGAYRDANEDQALAAFKSLQSGQVEELASILSRLKQYMKLSDTANHVRLGARAAALENFAGNFGDNNEVLHRIIDTMFSGSIIQHFVKLVRSMTQLNGLLQGTASLPEAELDNRVKMATNAIEECRADEMVDMFDMPQIIRMRFDVMSNVSQHQIVPKTVVAIVEEEIGIPLPEPVADLLRAALNLGKAFGL